MSTLSLVTAGLGVSIVPESMTQLETNGISYLHADLSVSLTVPLLLARRKGDISGALMRFTEIVDQRRHRTRKIEP